MMRLNQIIYGLMMTLMCLPDQTDARFKDKETPCGTFGYNYPATNTRPLQLRLRPKTFEKNERISWTAEKDGRRILLNNAESGVSIYNSTNIFYLDHDNWTDYNYAIYFVVSGTCKALLQIEQTDIGECGYLERSTDDLIAGGTLLLTFVPTSYVWENSNISYVSWLHFPKTCYGNCSTSEISESTNYKFNVTTNKAEYVLTIQKTSRKTSGNYVVECPGRGRSNDISIDIIVPEPPNKPFLLPLVEIDSESYVLGRNGKQLEMSCNVTGGTNTTVEILIGQSKMTTVYKDGLYTLTSFPIEHKHHKMYVICTVQNAALDKPLAAISKIYVIKNPPRPILTVEESVEFKPPGVTCSVTNVRPKPELRYFINGISIGTNNSKQENIFSDAYYNSEATLVSLARSWNKKRIKCCASNEMYDPQELCSVEKVFSYKFRWEEISLQLPDIPQEMLSFYVMSFICIVVNANPAYEIVWSGNGIVDKHEAKITETMDGGFTTSQTVVLNVTEANNHQTLTCYVQSSTFEPEKITHELILPALPKVSMNVSTGNMSTVAVILGESFVVECSAYGEPPPQISWNISLENERDIRVFPCGSEAICLGIESTNKRHRGVYACTAQNVFGITTQTIELDVKESEHDSLPSSLPTGMIIGLIFLVIFIILAIVVSAFYITRYMKSQRQQPERDNGRSSEEGKPEDEEATSNLKSEQGTSTMSSAVDVHQKVIPETSEDDTNLKETVSSTDACNTVTEDQELEQSDH